MMFRAKTHPQFRKWSARTLEKNRKAAIRLFEEVGHANHSSNALLLPFVINYCEENKIPYKLTAHPHWGYYVEKAEPIK